MIKLLIRFFVLCILFNVTGCSSSYSNCQSQIRGQDDFQGMQKAEECERMMDELR